MKNVLVKSLALTFVFALAGCEKNRDADDPMTKGETTTPHSMEAEPVSPNNEMHNDMQNNTSAPILDDSTTSDVHTGTATSGQTP